MCALLLLRWHMKKRFRACRVTCLCLGDVGQRLAMAADEKALTSLSSVIRRTLLARTTDHDLVEDLTQETLVRVAAAQARLEGDMLRAYAIVTARNTLNDHLRQSSIGRRHLHRLVEYRSLDGPEALTLEREETDALASALDKLDPRDRQLLVEHEAEGATLDELAARHGTTSRAVSMRLSRARAVLRVEFVVAYRRIRRLPVQCRNNLVALSAGDSRRQTELGAADHLLHCATCAELSHPVAARRRGIAAMILVPATTIRRFIVRLRRSHVTQAVAATVAVVAATIAFLALRPSTHAPTAHQPAHVVSTQATRAIAAPAPAPGSTAHSTQLAPVTNADRCAGAAGAAVIDANADSCPFEIAHARVTTVPADEGFWITAPDGQPAWVSLIGTGESPAHIVAGDVVDLTGVIRANTPQTTAPIPADQLAQVNARTAHLEVNFDAVVIDR
ncbi:MAG: rsbT [Ilumatobacteraceae bacterium]|nr:rsbT [Ilumatobacteraceae bacterium]